MYSGFVEMPRSSRSTSRSPIVLFEVMKGSLMGSPPEVGKVHHVQK